jgi:hypothetical protein
MCGMKSFAERKNVEREAAFRRTYSFKTKKSSIKSTLKERKKNKSLLPRQ